MQNDQHDKQCWNRDMKLPLTLPPTQIDISGLLMICYQIQHDPAFILTNLKNTNLVFRLFGGELSHRKSKIVTWTCNHREFKKKNGNLVILADCCWPAYSETRYSTKALTLTLITLITKLASDKIQYIWRLGTLCQTERQEGEFWGKTIQNRRQTGPLRD